MGKQQDLDILWRKMRQLDREITQEARNCAAQGRRTKRHETLCSDMKKLKDEYEKLKGGGSYNSLSLDHGERHTTRSVIKNQMGQAGPDTHHKLED